jgi:D-3-phosphoglycerate dehydrogenase / 2-oxoglutarate reductase
VSRRVLITCRQMQNCLDEFSERFSEHDLEIDAPEVVQAPTEDELIELIGEAEGMIAGDDPLSARVLEHAKRLRIISKWGVGTDGIDRAAAERLGIRVTNTPAVFGNEVADVAAGYIVLLARKLHLIDASVRDGGWLKIEGRSLAGKTLGVVGFGDIGQAVARRGAGFDMHVCAHDVDERALALAAERGVDACELGELLSRSDFVVLCCPLTEQTRHLVNEDSLALMPPGAYLVNVSRGPLVDEPALVRALRSGHLAGAALDVFEEEPLPADSELRGLDGCVFGTHNASNTREAVLRASERAFDNLLEGLG